MAAPVQGVGSLLANDILTDCAFWLIEPCVNTTVPAGGIAIGSQTVATWDNSLYVGALILVGVLGGDLEVVEVTEVNSGVSFTATFTNPHVAGEPIIGATFPVQNTAGDPFFRQDEMLQYLSDAVNDFLLRCPLVYNVADLNMPPTAEYTPLPSDCMMPVRVAAQELDADLNTTGYYGLRETSQSNLDSMTPLWNQLAADVPRVYYRDKIPLQNVGIWPRPANTTPLEVVYQQRGAETIGLADGFLLPDPFLVYVKSRVLEFCYSKDGEQRSPGLAKFWNSRYEIGCKISKVFLEAVMDANLQ